MYGVAISFRDPAGQVRASGARILRAVQAGAAAALEDFGQTAAARRFLERGQLVSARALPAAEVETQTVEGGWFDEARAAALVLEHERIPFPSYPYEWPPEMLHAAGLLTLDLAEQSLAEGFGLKDATPYNVLYRGPSPVFVDWLSFERRAPADPVWLPAAQFLRTFLLPLLADRSLGLPVADTLWRRRDGIEPQEMYRWCAPWRRVLPPFLSLVSIPSWLERRPGHADARLYAPRRAATPAQAHFIVASLFRRLRRSLVRLAPRTRRSSRWSEYGRQCHYAAQPFAAKHEFVEQVLRDCSPRAVLDVGSNTGHFSRMAARAGARVVALDSDAAVAGELWRSAQAARLDILPLVIDAARPSPAAGWRNQEHFSFIDRTRGGFDLVMILALLHHLTVSEGVPLGEVLDFAAELTRRWLLIEFIAPADPQFRALVRGRDALYARLDRPAFEAACSHRFDIVTSRRLRDANRWIYLLRLKGWR